MRFIYLFFCSCIVVATQAQSVDSLEIEDWFTTAIDHLEKDQTEDFNFFYNKVAEGLIANKDLYGWISKHRAIGKKILYEKDQLEDALVYFEKSTIENLFQKPEADKSWEELGLLYIFVGYINGKFDNHDLAEKAYNKAEDILVQRLDMEDTYVADFLYLPLSTIYTKKGDYSASEILLEKTYKVYMTEGLYNDAASTLSDLSIIYRDLDQPGKAIQICEKGLAMGISDEVSLGLLNSNLAQALFLNGDFDKSLESAYAAEGYFKILLEDEYYESEAVGWLAVNKGLIGEINTALGDFAAANAHYSEADLLFDNLYENKYNRDYGKNYFGWGMGKLEEPDNAGALDMFQKSLQSMLPSFKAENPTQNPSIEDLYGENTLMEALLGKALAFDRLYDDEGNETYLTSALECHDLIFEVEKLLRQSFHFEDSKLLNVEESRERCGHAISLCMKLAKGQKEAIYHEKAFEFAEKSKAVLLLDAFMKNSSFENSGLPEELINAEKTYQQDITALEKQLYNLGTSTTPDSLEIQKGKEALFNLKTEYADWVEAVRVKYGGYYNNRYNDSTISVNEIQKNLLGRKETMLEYFVGKSMIYLFVITNKQFEIIEIERTPDLEKEVLAMQQSIQQYNRGDDPEALCNTYTRLGQKFYNLLLREAKEKGLLKECITVIPSGILSYIQFDVLLAEAPINNCLFNEYKYAIYQHNFSYGYSATLHYRLNDLTHLANGNLLGFGPEFDGKNGWGKLNDNVTLLEDLETFWEGIYELNKDANIKRLQELIKEQPYEIIHFSTHAEANMDEGDFSFIVFSDGSEGYDSLFVTDIYQLHLLAEMVVLGACETAVGKLHDGEGVISLARAFLQTGSRSVITTLWSVYDGTNKEVLIDFYKNLENGMSKSEALRKAKLVQTTRDAKSAHPIYWAAYTPYGKMTAIRAKTPVWAYLLAGGLIVVFGFFIFKGKKNKKSSESEKLAVA
jgi:CHAT domain-containing protein